MRSRRSKQPFQQPVVVHDDRLWGVPREHSGKVTAVLEVRRQRLCSRRRQVNRPIKAPREEPAELTYRWVPAASREGSREPGVRVVGFPSREHGPYATGVDVHEFHRNGLMLYELEHGVRDEVHEAVFVLRALDGKRDTSDGDVRFASEWPHRSTASRRSSRLKGLPCEYLRGFRRAPCKRGTARQTPHSGRGPNSRYRPEVEGRIVRPVLPYLKEERGKVLTSIIAISSVAK